MSDYQFMKVEAVSDSYFVETIILYVNVQIEKKILEHERFYNVNKKKMFCARSIKQYSITKWQNIQIPRIRLEYSVIMIFSLFKFKFKVQYIHKKRRKRLSMIFAF